MKYKCARCKKPCNLCAGHVNRSRRNGWKLYCGRKCAGMAHRLNKSKAQRIAEKAVYDAKYRAKNREMIKAKKAAYFQRTYDPIEAAKYRKARMAKHVEYCRRPEYKTWKREYDRGYRAKTDYGPFAEAFMALMDLEKEISSRMTRYEVYSAKGTLNKKQTRRKEYESLISS